MTDAERVLSLLLHDVRTPLGVAHGYLRLIRDERLPSAEERDRALAGTQQALGRITRLCEDASAFLDDGPAALAARMPAAALVERVVAALEEHDIAIDGAPPTGLVAVGASLDRTGQALATLLLTRAKRPGAGRVRVDVDGAALRFASGDPVGQDTQPFDPWHKGQNLTVVLAHRLVTALGGRVWTTDGERTIVLSVPMENEAA